MMKKSITICCSLALLLIINSCTSEYYTIKDFAVVKKIDTHVHLDAANTAVAEQAKADKFSLVALSVDVPENPPIEKQNEFSILQRKQYPEQINFITAFTLKGFYSPNWTNQIISQLKSDFTNGALGIKIWKNIGMAYKDSTNHFIMIDDPKFDSVINYIIGQDKTIIGHLGEPKNCWLPIEKMTVKNDKNYFKEHPEYHMFLHPEYPSYEDQINARDRFIERHSNMRFVGAHLGSLEWSVDELAKRLDKFPNMAVDMAARICHLQYQSQKDREKIRQFIIKYQDRLIYATDSSIDSTSNSGIVKADLHKTWQSDWEYFVSNNKMKVEIVDGEFTGLQLPKQVIDKIYYHNAVRWFKIKE